MRLGLNKRSSLWLLTVIATAIVVSFAVVVECIPFDSQLWNVADYLSYNGQEGVLNCVGEDISCSETCVASNTPSSILHPRTCSDVRADASFANRIYSDSQFDPVKTIRNSIRNLPHSRIWRATLGGSTVNKEGYANAQWPPVRHNHNHNINNHGNSHQGGGKFHISAAMRALFSALPVAAPLRISSITNTALQTFSNQSDSFFGSLLSASPAQSTGCPNPAAVLGSFKGTQDSIIGSEGNDLSANTWKFTSKFASYSQYLIKPSPRRKASLSEPERSNSTDTATATSPTNHDHHLTSKNFFDPPSTQAPPEQPRSRTTLYKYQEQTEFAHIPVTSGRKELRGSCLGLIVGLVASIMWF